MLHARNRCRKLPSARIAHDAFDALEPRLNR
jgi:hypothetical protein